jgi:hypothetical protein
VFCLACGARLAPLSRPPDGNGVPATGAPPTVPAPAEAGLPGRKQAYALSFKALPDERLRYRVARWVVERAPAHALSEVQESLQTGTFMTFLALTASEAEAARQGIEGLGVAAPFVHLAPATTAQLLLPQRPARPAPGTPSLLGSKRWVGIAVAGVGLLLFGLVVARLFGGRAF